MNKKITLLVCIFLLPYLMRAQSVGYQGKKFIANIGYMPVNNLAGKYLGTGFYDAYDISNNNNQPIIIKHVPFISFEYAIRTNLSVMVKYNPFKVVSNVSYYATGSATDSYIGGQTNGSMFNIGIKKYRHETAAPLGSYFGLSAILFRCHNAFVTTENTTLPAPIEITNYSLEDATMVAIVGAFGVQNIFWDKVTLDIGLQAGYFFGDGSNYDYTFDSIADTFFFTGSSVMTQNFLNTKMFFYATPSISLGYLLF